MKKFILNKKFVYLLGIILFFILWGLISLLIKNNTIIFPSPIDTFIELKNVLSSSFTYKCIFTSIWRMLLGFVVSFILAFILATIASYKTFLEDLFKPTIVALKSAPTIVFIFLFLVLVGAKYSSIFVVGVICFPILYESILGGYKNINKDLENIMRLNSKSPIRNLFTIRIPLAFPYILVGILSSFALSIKIEVMAEIISGDTTPGLGALISLSQKQDPSNMAKIFAYGLIIIIFMILITFLETLIKRKED